MSREFLFSCASFLTSCFFRAFVCVVVVVAAVFCFVCLLLLFWLGGGGGGGYISSNL